MTLKEQIFKLKDIKTETENLIKKKQALKESINIDTLKITQDWETIINQIRDVQRKIKNIEKQEEILKSEFEEIQSNLLQLLYELNLSELKFDLGDMLIKVSNLADQKVSFIHKKENIGVN